MIRAIIIDDEKTSREALLGLITRYCNNVTIVDQANGYKSGLASIHKHNPDLVFLDIQMPKLDGFEIIKKIRSDEEIKDIYIFIFTDVSDEDSKARGLQIGANQYFLKDDFSPEEFAEKVGKIMENREAMEGSENTFQV